MNKENLKYAIDLEIFITNLESEIIRVEKNLAIVKKSTESNFCLMNDIEHLLSKDKKGKVFIMTTIFVDFSRSTVIRQLKRNILKLKTNLNKSKLEFQNL